MSSHLYLIQLQNKLVEKLKGKIKIVFTIVMLYICIKLYKKWRYLQMVFNSSQTNTKVIFLTGCDTGFGNRMALKLSIEHNYRVIATCLKKESVDKFLCNSLFVSNKSTAIVLDVTNKDNIESVKQYVIKYLSQTNATLWGIVNNAGFFIPGSFELVPQEMEKLQWDVLYNGPLNIIRAFLPLLPGRMNYKTIKDTKTLTSSNGGRIVNMSSITAHLLSDTRYGPAKKSLEYMSHALRMELSTRFGIWVSSVEPSVFGTNIWRQGGIWTKKVMENLKQNNKIELANVYGFKQSNVETEMNGISNALMDQGPNIDMVVDDVIHALIAKYPYRMYRPGWSGKVAIVATYAPLWYIERYMQDSVGLFRKEEK